MVTEQLVALSYPNDAPVVVLAGERYRAPLQGWLGDRGIVPMEGMPIGLQLSWLSNQVRTSEPV
jgi:hypothetical protein